jgi:hypothetical protein
MFMVFTNCFCSEASELYSNTSQNGTPQHAVMSGLAVYVAYCFTDVLQSLDQCNRKRMNVHISQVSARITSSRSNTRRFVTEDS